MAPDPANVAYVWFRYRRLMRWLMAVTVALMLVALRLAFRHGAPDSIRRYVLAALGVGMAMLVSSAVMGFRFLRRRQHGAGAGENPPPARRRPDVPE